MKADSLHMGKVFSSGGDVHYVLPHFQREYAWDKTNWQTLVKDVFSTYEVYDEEKPPEHFMGALVVINDGTRNGTVPVFRLVDGQQRLTSISLMLCALGRLVKESDPALYKKIRRFLLNADEPQLLRYKLLPTKKYGDRDTYLAILEGKEITADVDSKIPEAFSYLHKEMATRLKQGKFEPNRLFIVLVNCLQVVFIDLDGSERPYEIFESLNYKGKSLTQADLVRNYIAMKLPEARQTEVFEDYWSPIEETLQEKRTVGRSRLGELTAFLRHYFAFLGGVLVNKDHVYSRFRDRGETMSTEEFIEEIRTLKRFAGYYDRLLRPERENDDKVRRQLERLNILESATAYPFLLFMYDKREQGEIDRDAFLDGLRSLEVYMVRRFMAKESTNYLNKMFPTLGRDVVVEDFADSLRTTLMEKNFPSDVRLRQAAETVKLYDRSSYTRQKLGLIFEAVNRHLSAGSGAYTQLDDDPTIEHIMPQTLTEQWRQHIGNDWPQDYELLHTLGNLTLVTQEWNSSLSNAIYATKKGKLAKHGLLLNRTYFNGGPEHWDGDAIKTRAQWIMERINEIWPVLAEVQISEGWKERPKALTILDEAFEVKTWRDVAQQTAECVALWTGDKFEERIVSALPTYFEKEPERQPARELSNGWWLYVNLSADSVKNLCQTMLEEAGIPEEEFDLELW